MSDDAWRDVQRRRDIATVSGFIVGWWPGLEDGIDFSTNLLGHTVYLAALRLRATTPERNGDDEIPNS